jgi:group I intron endonuclease
MVGIYKITSPSGKIYIGQSINIKNRISTYRNKKCSEQPRLYKSILKYGFENHNFEIVCNCDIIELNEKERFYQEFYDCIGEKGLNCVLTKTKDRSGKSSEETKLKISLNNTKPFLGRKHTTESKIKMSNSLKGKKSRLGAILSKETKNKISNSHKGKTASDEVKLKMSISRKGKPRIFYNDSFKKVFDKETNILYNSVKECSIILNINLTTLRHKLNGTRKNNTSLTYA